MRTRIFCSTFAALVSALALAVLVLPAASASAADDGKREAWVRKYQALQAQHAQLEQELDNAKIDYSRGRSTKHLRGEGKAGLIEEIARLEEEFDKVDRELMDFPDEARKQGALPGWFRDVPPQATAQPAAALGIEADDEDEGSQSKAERRAAERKRRRLSR
jgi:hypothetical protein